MKTQTEQAIEDLDHAYAGYLAEAHYAEDPYTKIFYEAQAVRCINVIIMLEATLNE